MKLTVLNYELKKEVQAKIKAFKKEKEGEYELRKLIESDFEPPEQEIFETKEEDFEESELAFYPDPALIEFIMELPEGGSEVKISGESFHVKENHDFVYGMKMRHILGKL